MPNLPKLTRRAVMQSGLAASSTLFMPAIGRSAALPADLNCRYVFPEDPAAGKLNASYNSDHMLVPKIRAMPGDVDAVARLIKWARDTQIGFAVRTGGHSFVGASQHHDLVIDMRDMNAVTLDAGTGLARIAGGTQLWQVHAALAPLDVAIAGGTHPTVGLVGLGTGGGLGYFSRSVGLMCDQFIELTLIDANGEVHTVNAEQDADLFWALQGGGASSFGIITDVRVRTLSPGVIHHVSITEAIAPEKALEVILYWLVWAEQTDDHTTTHLSVTRYGAGRVLVHVSGVAGGERDELVQHLSFILGKNINDGTVMTGPISKTADALMWGQAVVQTQQVSRSRLLDIPVHPLAIGEMLNVLMRHPSGSATIGFETLGGAVREVASTATAFPHRDARFAVHIQAGREIAPPDAKPEEAVNDIAKLFDAFSLKGTYMNYPEADLENWAEAYWGQNLPRLQTIKAKYDPDNVFNHAQSVPLP